MLLDGRAQETGIKRRGSDATLLLVYNAHHDIVNFVLPEVADGQSWLGLVDTNQPDAAMTEFGFGHAYAVTGRSLLVFGLANDGIGTRRLRQGLGALLDIADRPLAG
jgi:glycogen operon protein